MIKNVVTAASFALGAAGVVLVGYLQTSPLAFTQSVVDIGVDQVPGTVVGDAPDGTQDVIVVSEVVVTHSLHRPSPPSGPVASLEPCSTWNEVGALYVAPGGATGVHAVRSLCP